MSAFPVTVQVQAWGGRQDRDTPARQDDRGRHLGALWGVPDKQVVLCSGDRTWSA